MIGSILKSMLIGMCLYLAWYVLPPIKKSLLRKWEVYLKNKGKYNGYMAVHVIIKKVLYGVLILMIVAPILFFVYLFAL